MSKSLITLFAYFELFQDYLYTVLEIYEQLVETEVDRVGENNNQILETNEDLNEY